MRDPAAEKGADKTTPVSTLSVSLNARSLGWACPCPALREREAGLHFKGGLLGLADTVEPRVVDICQTCELSFSMAAVISARFPL